MFAHHKSDPVFMINDEFEAAAAMLTVRIIYNVYTDTVWWENIKLYGLCVNCGAVVRFSFYLDKFTKRVLLWPFSYTNHNIIYLFQGYNKSLKWTCPIHEMKSLIYVFVCQLKLHLHNVTQLLMDTNQISTKWIQEYLKGLIWDRYFFS